MLSGEVLRVRQASLGKGVTLMRRITVLGAIIGSVLVLVAGCGGSSGNAGGTGDAPQNDYAPKIDSAEFTTTIDNEYFPLEPGTTFVYEGGAQHGEMTVTSDTKRVMGVECVVVDDRAWEAEIGRASCRERV